MKKVFITGITGQDGLFLTQILSEKNFKIYGTSRSLDNQSFFKNLHYLGVETFENIFKLDLLNYSKVKSFINDIKPDYIVNLSGPSSVYDSYKRPIESQNQIISIFNNLINSCIELNFFPTIFQASSSEMFKQSDNKGLDENCEFDPKSPYAKAKFINHMRILDLVKKYDWNIKSGIMFNHESEFRTKDYLFMKVINAAYEIKIGKIENLAVGSLVLERDWSFAGDVAKAIESIMISGKDNTYVIGEGKPKKIKDLIEIVFDYNNLNFEQYIIIDEKLLRKGDPLTIYSDPKKLKDELKWSPKLSFEELVFRCIKQGNYK